MKMVDINVDIASNTLMYGLQLLKLMLWKEYCGKMCALNTCDTSIRQTNPFGGTHVTEISRLSPIKIVREF